MVGLARQPGAESAASEIPVTHRRRRVVYTATQAGDAWRARLATPETTVACGPIPPPAAPPEDLGRAALHG